MLIFIVVGAIIVTAITLMAVYGAFQIHEARMRKKWGN